MKIEIATKQDLEEIKSLLMSLIPQSKSSDEGRKWIRGSEVQEYLGISNTKLHELRQSGKLTFSKYGNIYYYDINSVLAEIERNKVLCRVCK
jgi:hypothetical protein